MTRVLRRARPGALLAGAYLGGVAVLTIAHIALKWPTVHSIALTPALFAHGEVWLLATSSLLVASDSPAVALVALLALGCTMLSLGNARRFWGAAVAGHLGSTVITYAGVAVLWLGHVRAVDALLDQPDYGISCVWAGALGAMAVSVQQDPRRIIRLGVPAASASMLVYLTLSSDGLARPEHFIAFVLGALVGLRLRQRASHESLTIRCSDARCPV